MIKVVFDPCVKTCQIVCCDFIFQYITYRIFRFGFVNKIRFINRFTKNDPNPFFLKKLPNEYKLLISNHQAKSIQKQLVNIENNYSIRKYFGFVRASGIDHFDSRYKNIPFEKRGIFKQYCDSLCKYKLLSRIMGTYCYTQFSTAIFMFIFRLFSAHHSDVTLIMWITTRTLAEVLHCTHATERDIL